MRKNFLPKIMESQEFDSVVELSIRVQREINGGSVEKLIVRNERVQKIWFRILALFGL